MRRLSALLPLIALAAAPTPALAQTAAPTVSEATLKEVTKELSSDA